MKNIIILGSPRVGKSSLASLLCQKYDNMHYISGDSIRNGFIKFYPELKYTSENMKQKIDFCKFINHIIIENNIHLKRNINYIVDTTDITIENAIDVFKESIIIVLGCKDLSEEEYKDIIKKNDTKLEWTWNCSDVELLNVCRESINLSKQLYVECEKYNIPYFETSTNRKKVFSDIIKYIDQKVGVIND